MATWRKYFNSSSNAGLPVNVTGTPQTAMLQPTMLQQLATQKYMLVPKWLMRYIHMTQMDNDLEINAPLDILAEFCTQDDDTTGLPFMFSSIKILVKLK